MAWKRDFPRPNVSCECLSRSATLSYTITKKKKRVFCDAKVIEDPEAPEGLLEFSLGVTVRGSSSRSSVTDSCLGSSVLFFRHAAIFHQKVLLLFFIKSKYFVLHHIFKKNFAFTNYWRKKWRNTCMIQTWNIILKIYVIKSLIYIYCWIYSSYMLH